MQTLPLGRAPRRELTLGTFALQRHLKQLRLDEPLHSRRLSAAVSSVQQPAEAQTELDSEPEPEVEQPSPFALFDSPEYERFVNMLMKEGKKQAHTPLQHVLLCRRALASSLPRHL